jgi:hypothetical protein
MKDHTQPTTAMRLINRLKEIDPATHSPADRELRRLRGLSAEVGTACTAWLTARGIKTRTWASYEPKPRRACASS